MSEKGQSRRANCPISNESKKTQDTTSVLPGPILSHAAQYGVKTKPDKSPLFLAAFLAALLLLSPSPGRAQTYEVAISNIDRGFRNIERRSVRMAQTFTTGSRYGGYGIYSVEIAYGDAQGDEFSAHIYEVDSNDKPKGHAIIYLVTSDDFSSDGNIVFTPREQDRGKLLDENTSYAMRVISDDQHNREVDYVVTYRGARLDCPTFPPCTTAGGCPALPTACDSDTEYGGEKVWKGWGIRPQLFLWDKHNGWIELTYYKPNEDRLNVAMLTRIKTIKISGPPTSFNAFGTSGGVELHWSPPESSGGSSITGYRYRARVTTDATAWTDWVKLGAHARSVAPEGLTVDTEYKFQLQAGNDGGWSKAVLSPYVTISDGPPPPDLSWTPDPSNGSIDLTWEAVDGAIRYDIRWRGNSDGWEDADAANDEQLEWLDIGNVTEYKMGDWRKEGSEYPHYLATDGREYTVQVRGVSTATPGAHGEVSVTPKRVVEKTDGFTAITGHKHVELTWLNPKRNDFPPGSPAHVGNARLSRDHVNFEYRVDNGEWHSIDDSWQYAIRDDGVNPGSVATRPNRFVVSGLQNYSDYSFEIRAVTDALGPGSSASAGVSTSGNVVNEVLLKTSDDVKRRPVPTFEDANNPNHTCSTLSIHGWDFECYWIAGTGEYRTREDFEAAIFLSSDDFLIQKTYKIKTDYSVPLASGDIVAMSLNPPSHQHGEWEITVITDRLSSTVGRVETPGMPGYLGAFADGNRIDLVWLTTYPPSTSYEVEWSANGKIGWQAVDPPDDGSDTMYSHTDLTPYTGYFYRVRGVNSYGHGPWSPQAYAETGAQRKPSEALTDFTASAVSATTVNLSWTAPSGDVTGYEVEWSADGSTNWTAVDPAHSGTTTRYSHTGLTANTEYFYRVRATGDDGVGEWSDAISARTAPVATTGEGGSGEGGGNDAGQEALVAASLTAVFAQVPASHDGQSAFTLEVHFSAAFPLSYRTMRDAVLDVTGGLVTRARRLVSGSD